MTEHSPGLRIERHRAELRALDNEAAFLGAVKEIVALADSDDSSWDKSESWTAAYRLIAAADVASERSWTSAVGPIYERVALGDLDGLMQSIRHGPERAFGNDLNGFANVLEPLVDHQRPGTRQWAVRELGILRLRRSVVALLRAASDPVVEVRNEAITSLRMLAQRHPEAAAALDDLD
jgi:hypothetical protein